MDVLNETGSQEIDALREPMAAAVVARQFDAQPQLAGRYGASGRSKCLEDARFHLGYLSEAVAATEPALFVHYIRWLAVTLGHRGISTDDIQRNLEVLRAVLIAELTGDTSLLAASLVDEGLEALKQPIDEPPSFFRDDQAHSVLIKEYWNALLGGDRQQATDIVLDAVRRGTTVRDIYLAVIRTCQYELGRLWQINRVSVAQEHYCSAVTQQIMSQLYPYIFASDKTGPSLVAVCVGGELHEIGLRTVTDLFELEGWNTLYVGASTPTRDLVKLLAQRRPELLLVSGMIPYHFRAVANLVRAVRASKDCQRTRIFVGGYLFNMLPELWRKTGADGSAADAGEALIAATRILEEKSSG